MTTQQEAQSAARLQQDLVGFIWAFGLLSSDRTPCGQPMAPSDAHALTEIADGGVSQRDLVNRLHLDRSSVSRLVERLVVRGWVTRTGGNGDRRTIQLTATPAGERIAAEIAQSRSQRFASLMQAIPPDRRSEVLDSLRLLIEAAHDNGGSR